MQRGERHLGGAGQVQLVLGHAVDLLLGVGQHARCRTSACSRTSTGGITGVKPLLLEQRRAPTARARAPAARAAPSGRRSASRPRGRRASMSEVLAEQLDVVAAGRARLAHLAQHLVLVRRGRVGQVRQRGEHARCAAPRPRAAPPPARFSRAETPRDLGDRLGRVLAGALQLADPLRGLVLARAAAPPARAAARGGARRARAPRRAAPGRRRAGASASRAGCGSSRISLRSSTATSPGSASRRLAARVLATGSRRPASASSPTTTFAGMIAPGEAAVADGEQHVVAALLAHVEVRPVGALAALELPLRLRSVGVGGLERVAAGAALVEQHGALVSGLLCSREPRSRRRSRRRGGRGGERSRMTVGRRHGGA